MSILQNLFKSLVQIEVNNSFPLQNRGRPRILTFEDAFDNILMILQTGMQWRHLRPKTVSHITTF